jgi:hypothetical protein
VNSSTFEELLDVTGCTVRPVHRYKNFTERGGGVPLPLFARLSIFSDGEQTKMYLFLIKVFANGFELLKTRTWFIINPAKKIMSKKMF